MRKPKNRTSKITHMNVELTQFTKLETKLPQTV